MAEGLTNDLLWVATVIAILAVLVAYRDFPPIVAITLATVRITIPTVYFAWYFDGAWTLLDDQAYLGDGADLLRHGFTPLTVLFSDDGYEYLCAMCGGHHILYSWWNLMAQYIFGEHYYAPVFLNVLVTFCTGLLLGRTLDVLGVARGYRLGLQAFYLLHWEVISWSSFVNLKDCIVQMLTVATLYFIVRFYRWRDLRSIAGFAFVVFTFYWIRFYVPILILLATVLWMIWQWNDRWKYVLMVPLIAAGYYYILPNISENTEFITLESIFSGTARMLVTPLPWSVVEEYSFLLLSSILHLLFLIPAIWGMWALWQSYPVARLYLIYLMIIIGLYAVVEILLGPRHRFQIAFVFAWAQFHFLWMLRPIKQPATTLRPIASSNPLPLRSPRPIGNWA